jgi:hypothetical protein
VLYWLQGQGCIECSGFSVLANLVAAIFRVKIMGGSWQLLHSAVLQVKL